MSRLDSDLSEIAMVDFLNSDSYSSNESRDVYRAHRSWCWYLTNNNMIKPSLIRLLFFLKESPVSVLCNIQGFSSMGKVLRTKLFPMSQYIQSYYS